MTEAARTSDPNQNAVFGGNDSRAAATPKPGEAVGNGVFGFSMVPNASGVFGANNNGGVGVAGASEKNFGVRGDSTTGFAAVHGHGGKNGVWGLTNSAADSGVFGQNDGAGAGVFGFSKNGAGVRGLGKVAGRFEGDVEVTGDIRLVNADCAEDFDVAIDGTAEPGTVVVCDADGALRPSMSPYDKKVVGIVSGAGGYKPAIVLDRQESLQHRAPVALMGKVFCNVDAAEHAIEVGDLLTTSSSPGHAMKATDPSRAFGAVIGKALRPLASGRGKIPVLVALQ